MLVVGTYLGDRYEILELIGSGGMADVYRAKCHKLNRFVAIKVLKSEFSNDAGFVSKFKAEAQAAAGLMHPNIVNVYDVGEENGMYYFVMELVEGITLKHYIEKKIRLTSKEAVSIAIQVSMGIEAAHNNGIIHRDIKPQNIIISKEGKVKVADFGIAKAVSSNTITSHAMGSVHYTSPEQARGGYSDAKSDIYSIGITLFEMVTGHVPFDGETTVAVAIKHIQEDMPSPRVYVPDCPISVEEIINKCCQKNPDRRYQSAGMLIKDLKYSLSNPDESFVVIRDPASSEGTKTITDNDKVQIRKQSVVSGPAYDNILPRYDTGSMGRAAGNTDPHMDNYEEEVYEPRKRKARPIIEEPDIEDEREVVSRQPKTSRQASNRMNSYDEYEYEAQKRKSAQRRSDAYRDEYYEDELDDDVDPKMEKIVTILMVIAAIIIAVIAGVVVYSIIGGSADDKPSSGVDISITTSKGDDIEVPNIVGKSVEEASSILYQAGLEAISKKQESTEYEAGFIMSQEPAAGATVKPGTKLSLIVSSGKVVGATVPDVVGLTEAEAKVKLEAEGFVMQKQLQESRDVEKGVVISQNPLGASTVPSGSDITVVVSSGSSTPQIEMPNLVNKNQEEAKVLIEESNLVCRNITEENSDTVEKGRVISQSVSAGATVEEGTSVDLVISLGKLVKTYAIVYQVPVPPNYFNGTEASVVLANSSLQAIKSYTTTSFPFAINETGIADVDAVYVTVTYLTPEGGWETTTPALVPLTPEG